MWDVLINILLRDCIPMGFTSLLVLTFAAITKRVFKEVTAVDVLIVIACELMLIFARM